MQRPFALIDVHRLQIPHSGLSGVRGGGLEIISLFSAQEVLYEMIRWRYYQLARDIGRVVIELWVSVNSRK